MVVSGGTLLWLRKEAEGENRRMKELEASIELLEADLDRKRLDLANAALRKQDLETLLQIAPRG